MHDDPSAHVAGRARRASSFGAIALDYDRYRAEVPDEVVAWFLPAPVSRVLDLAAGTGSLTRGLVRRLGSAAVVAVEPDDRMRAVLTATAPGVETHAGTAEAIPLGDASVDAVLVASAWHWFDPPRAVPEIARVLRPGGVLGVIWNSRRRDLSWLAFEDLIATRETPGAPPRPDRRRVRLPDDAPFSPAVTAELTWTRSMPVEDLVAEIATYSGLITMDPTERTGVLTAIRERLDAHAARTGGGPLAVPYVARCWRAVRARSGRGHVER